MTNKQRAFSITLEENAEDSLRHGLEHFLKGEDSSTDLKQAVLSVFNALELFMKARLAKAHPTLIFEKPEESGKASARTVEFDTLLGRLQAVGIRFTREQKSDLGTLRILRNQLNHHKYQGQFNEAASVVSKVTHFLRGCDLISQEWDELLGDDLARRSEEAICPYQERLKAATERAKEAINWDPKDGSINLLRCDCCGEETVPASDQNNSSGNVQCRFCGEEWFVLECDSCHNQYLSSDQKGFLCDSCHCGAY